MDTMARSKFVTVVPNVPVGDDEKEVSGNFPFRSRPSIGPSKCNEEQLSQGRSRWIYVWIMWTLTFGLNIVSSTLLREKTDSSPPELQKQTRKENDPSLEQIPHHIYIKITADLNARQINGDIMPRGSNTPNPRHYYHSVVATDHSIQINGNVHDPEALLWLLA